MKTVTDLWLLTKRPFMQNLRNPTWLFVGASTPILYLVLFMPLLKKLVGPGLNPDNVVQLFLPGIVALLAFGDGAFAGWGTLFSLKSGFIERIRVTPASRFALLVGPILANIVWMLIFSALIIGLSVPFGFHIHILGLIIFGVLLSLLVALFGAWSTAMAILINEMGSFAAVVNGINLPLILLAGVMLPLSLAPTWMRYVAHANPLYYVVIAGRELGSGKIATHNVGLAFVVIVPLTAPTLWWAIRVYRKAVA